MREEPGISLSLVEPNEKSTQMFWGQHQSAETRFHMNTCTYRTKKGNHRNLMMVLNTIKTYEKGNDHDLMILNTIKTYNKRNDHHLMMVFISRKASQG